jgi:hypothetical protein
MKYVVMQSTGGNVTVKSEWSDKDKAVGDFHNTCRLLYSDTETTEAVVAVLDERLDVVDGHKEFINKEVVDE